MSRDSLIVDLTILRKEMRGISPRLSLYTKLKEQEKQLLDAIGDDPQEIRKKLIDKNKFKIAKARRKGPIGGGPTPGHFATGRKLCQFPLCVGATKAQYCARHLGITPT